MFNHFFLFFGTALAYGWCARNLNWPIRIQLACSRLSVVGDGEKALVFSSLVFARPQLLRAWNRLGFSGREKNLVSWSQVSKPGKASKSVNFLTEDGIKYSRKGIYNFKNHTSLPKVKKCEPFCLSKLLFWRQKWVAGVRHGSLFVVSSSIAR